VAPGGDDDLAPLRWDLGHRVLRVAEQVHQDMEHAVTVQREHRQLVDPHGGADAQALERGRQERHRLGDEVVHRAGLDDGRFRR